MHAMESTRESTEDFAVRDAVLRFREPVHVVSGAGGRVGVLVGADAATGAGGRTIGTLPPLYPEWLGDRAFGEVHGVRFAYVAGEMANGIASTRMVVAMAEAEMLAFFGAGGLSLPEVDAALTELTTALGDRVNWGVNLIHSPNEPELENRVADLLLRREVPRVSASAFLSLTPAVVRCAAAGLHVDRAGRVVRPTRLFAKVSRLELAEQFMSPPPEEVLRDLCSRGLLTDLEARLAARLPVAEDITVEADSGGHTDNRPLVVLLPAVTALRDELARRFGYRTGIRVGAAGGLGRPEAVAAAFGLGAAYVVTGSVNQSAVEAGISEEAKQMLCTADVTDVTMAPALDMFEQGVRLQVLRRGTMFASRAARLFDAYRAYPALEGIPADVLGALEREVLGATVEEVWRETERFWRHRDSAELDRARRDPKHRMALVFRWYLGRSSRWAIAGESARRLDYQIWCGPAMGAFNRWVRDSPLEDPARRTVTQIAWNLMEGAAVAVRAQQLRGFGVPVPSHAFSFRPRHLDGTGGGR